MIKGLEPMNPAQQKTIELALRVDQREAFTDIPPRQAASPPRPDTIGGDTVKKDPPGTPPTDVG